MIVAIIVFSRRDNEVHLVVVHFFLFFTIVSLFAGAFAEFSLLRLLILVILIRSLLLLFGTVLDLFLGDLEVE